MGKRARVMLAVVAVLAVALVGVIVWQAWPPNEPVYQGKPLSFWMKPKWMGSPGRSGMPVLKGDNADAAVRQAGTNAIPTLLRLLRARDSALKIKLMALAQKQHVIKIEFIPAEGWNGAAVAGFSVLGTNGQNAVPELIDIANQNISHESQLDALFALGNIGPPAKAAIPSLLCFVTNADSDVRDIAMFALGRTHAEADRVVPVLINALSDPESGIRDRAAFELGRFGPEAKAAVPALVEYLNSAAEMYRPSATNALIKIDPEAAVKVGITNSVP